MNRIETIRYMGIKNQLLDYIVPAVQSVTPPNGTVLDIMAGSNSVSYALKEYYTVYTNDVQYYSKIISDAIIVNQSETISSALAHNELDEWYFENEKKHFYDFFTKTYSGTYFSQKQCSDIDSIRYAIERVTNPYKKALYLFALMGAMCKVQSTPGHFAQYMPANHTRIIPLQQMNLLDEFYYKCDCYQEICFTDKANRAYNCDFHDLLKDNVCDNVDTIYLDSPYTQEQYSRFYHVLETVTKYDSPEVHFKAKYRDDRFQSSFCYKSKVENEFRSIFDFCREKSVNLVISYSVKGVMPIKELERVAREYFDVVNVETINYKHSTQGKGNNKIVEVLLICNN